MISQYTGSPKKFEERQSQIRSLKLLLRETEYIMQNIAHQLEGIEYFIPEMIEDKDSKELVRFSCDFQSMAIAFSPAALRYQAILNELRSIEAEDAKKEEVDE